MGEPLPPEPEAEIAVDPPLPDRSVRRASSTSVTGITVASSQQIMAGTAAATITPSQLAQRIADQINLCTISATGNCQVAGYHAFASGSVVTIIAPGGNTDTPVVAKSGPMTLTATAFSAGSVPGTSIPTVITRNSNSYPYPGTAGKASARTDCTGATCTYSEEMTNYANWWTYYRTRMQSMKTAASNAFVAIDKDTDIANDVSRFRLGFMSINNNTNSDFLNLGEFKGTQKYSWYRKLVSAAPNNSTPFRPALATGGRLYAGTLNGSTLNGSTVTDPLQFSCQRNYTILSTDGFWNGLDGFKLDGTTAVGNQDAALPRPYNDGGSARLQTRTSTLQSQTITAQAQTSTSSLQSRTYSGAGNPLQQRDSTDGGATYGSWYAAAACAADNSGTNRTQCRGGLERRDSTDSGASFGAWYPVASCTVDNTGPTRSQAHTPNNLRDSTIKGHSWSVAPPLPVTTFTWGHCAPNITHAPCPRRSAWTNTSGLFQRE